MSQLPYLDPTELWVTIDAESIGLYGQAFSVAGILHTGAGVKSLELDGSVITGKARFMHHYHPDKASGTPEDREWVDRNVHIHKHSHLVHDYDELCELFVLWLKRIQDSYPGKRINLAADVAWPVEARFLLSCAGFFQRHRVNAPYPLHDVAIWMAAAGMDPMENYPRLEGEEPKHEAFADACQSARLLTEALGKLRARESIVRTFNQQRNHGES